VSLCRLAENLCCCLGARGVLPEPEKQTTLSGTWHSASTTRQEQHGEAKLADCSDPNKVVEGDDLVDELQLFAQAAPSPGSDPSARYRPVAETQLAPVPEPMPTAAGGDTHHAAGAAAAGAAAAVVGAVAAGTLAAHSHDKTNRDAAAGSADALVEQSAPSAASMGSQPSHLPDEAFCTGDAVPQQSPQPLLTKVRLFAAC
jgi:hypothetical protein